MYPSADLEKDFKSDPESNGITTLAPATSKEDAYFGSTSSSHRRLESYHINLISIGGVIGTALYVYIGSGLTKGGPANLFLAYLWWTSVIWGISNIQKEMVTFWPTDAAFARNASRYIDSAAGFAVGWNMYLNQVALIMFELVSFGLVITYWADAAKVSVAVYIAVLLVAYTILNIWDARFFGNAEFAFAIGKILLIIGLLIMTFITMLGGNPIHDRFGFRYWNNPGAFTTPYPNHPVGTGRFEGWIFCLINATFVIAGPDYISMVAGETRNPRKTIPKAFNNTIYRLGAFFVGSALAVGILCPYNDSFLLGAIAAGAPGAGRSPYVIAMNRMSIPILPHIVNGVFLTSVFSAGNAYVFCGARQLAQLARDGHAPKIFAHRNRNGVPYWSVSVSLLLSMLAFTRVSSSAAVVVSYISNLVGAAQLVNWIVMSVTWICWSRGLKAQGISRNSLPAKSRFAPFSAWYALVSSIFTMLAQGYYVFLKDSWSTPDFFFAYTMPILYVILFVAWKLVKRTKLITPLGMDLVSFIDSPEFYNEAYEVDDQRTGVSAYWHKFLKTFF